MKAPAQSEGSPIPHNLFTEQWRDLLVPTEPLQVPRPRGLRQRKYEQLVDEYNRLLAAIADLPTRSLWPHIQKAYEHQFLNRIVRVRRRLGLPAPGPPDRCWYRTGEAAVFLGVSIKSVLRWTASGLLRCERASPEAHRYYAIEELIRVRSKLRP